MTETAAIERSVEPPRRLEAFLQATSGLSWAPGVRRQSLEAVYLAINALAHAEIEYYDRQRRSTRRLSYWLRGAAWTFGTLGLIAPLLETALANTTIGLSRWGYVFLALAASALTGNAIFDGSAGHARNVKAQLELERLITLFRLDWYRLQAAIIDEEPSNSQLTEAFTLLAAFGAALYSTVGLETNEWNTMLAQATAELEKRVTTSSTAA